MKDFNTQKHKFIQLFCDKESHIFLLTFKKDLNSLTHWFDS